MAGFIICTAVAPPMAAAITPPRVIADLDCCEKPVRLFFESIQYLGVLVAFFDKLFYPDPP